MTRAVVIAAVLAACGTSEPSPTGDTFLAFSSSFAGFRTWTSFHSDGPPNDGTTSPEALGARTLYINAPPDPGSSSFPVGTIVVEERETGALFARVKRGGNYNRGGSIDWEWFEIVDDPIAIVWRGIGPPNGESYGGDPNACNNCHSACATNDYVCSPTLQLSSF